MNCNATPRLAVAVLCFFTTGLFAAQSQELRIDAASSQMVVHVGKTGLFGFAGHEHEVVAPVLGGTVMVDQLNLSGSKLTMQFDATAMKVTGKGEPAEDVPEVQRVMLSDKVLDAGRHPTIDFASQSVTVIQRSGAHIRLRINGLLTLRGVARRVTVPTDVDIAGNRLTAVGKTTIRQSDFGIRAVTAGGGTVKVKDDVELEFSIVATAPK